MAIPLCGRFEYVGVVPGPETTGPWQLHDLSTAPSSPLPGPVSDVRLVGLHPVLEMADAGVTPGVARSPLTGTVRPKVLLSRWTLRADRKDSAGVAAFSFCIDSMLLHAFRPGDTLHLARTGRGGLGMSLIRDGRLVFAIGAVDAVPHGNTVSIGHPDEAINEALDVFRRIDPEFTFRESPLELRIGSARRILYRGRPRIGDYNVFIEHGTHWGMPGADPCAAIALTPGCPEVGAIASALLLEYSELSTMERW
jgi:hypothetical protein